MVKEIGRLQKGIYIINLHTTEKPIHLFNKSAQACTCTSMDNSLWHKWFGPISPHELQKLIPCKVDKIAKIVNKCVICLCAKKSRNPFSSSSIKSDDSFDLIHMDIRGPYKTSTTNDSKYFSTIAENFSWITLVYLLKLKSGVCVIIQ